MGRSSIIFISILLSIDYGFRVSTFIELAWSVIQCLLCRLDYAWFKDNFESVKSTVMYIVPITCFFLALPLSFYTKIG